MKINLENKELVSVVVHLCKCGHTVYQHTHIHNIEQDEIVVGFCGECTCTEFEYPEDHE